MKKLFLILIIITVITIISPEHVSAQTLKFAQITDVHFSANPKIKSSRDVSTSAQNLRWAVQNLNRQNIDFVVFMGDNIDKSNETDLELFLQTVKDLNKPYYLIIGNHDAYKVGGVKKEDYIKKINQYNPNQKSKLPYYSFSPSSDFIAVVMDGAVPFVPSTHGIYTQETLDFLDKTLTKNKNKKILIFQHFPLIPPHENPSHTVLEAQNYWDVLKKHNNVVSISSGHYHNSKITLDELDINHISTPSLLTEGTPYDIVEINYTPTFSNKYKDLKIEVKPMYLQEPPM